MEKNDLQARIRKVLADADATLARSGMSARRRALLLAGLKEKEELRRLMMINKRKRPLRPTRRNRAP